MMEQGGVTDLSNPRKRIEMDNSQKRKSLNVQFSPRKKLNTRKSSNPEPFFGSFPDRNWSDAHRSSIPNDRVSPLQLNRNTTTKNPQETVILINPCAPKILPSHTALEDSTSRSVMPETAVYPSVLHNNAGSSFSTIQETFNMAANTGFMLPAPAYLPLSLDNDDIDGDQYHEIMQGLLQAIHNQNRIMEECRNILTSIHRAIVPFQPLPIMVPPTSPQLPLNLSSQQAPTNAWEPEASHTPAPEITNEIPATTTPPTIASIAMPMTSMTFDQQPQPASKTTQTSLSKEPEKPAVFGPDGEFSSAYLRYVHGKSSTATSFANVLMKEVFTLEERISSNCNGVMGKKALEAVRLDKIKRAVRRFYTDTEEEFQDMWKKCRKSIDSTNRNLKFVIMKKPNV